MPLFDAGQNSANLRAARAAYEQAVANYQRRSSWRLRMWKITWTAQEFLTRQGDAEAAACARRANNSRLA